MTKELSNPSKRLESLTVEQESLKSVIVKKWIDLSLNNGRKLQVHEVREGIDWIYEKAKLKSPLIIITPSPYFAQLTANYIKNIKPNILSELIKDFKLGANVWANVGANVRANVWDNVRANVWDNVGDNVGDNVRDNVWDNVGDNVWDNVGANVWDNVGANVRDNVGANVWANVGDNVRANVGDNVWDNVGANVGDNVRANVRANVGDNVGANVGDNVGDNVRDNVRDNVGANVRDNVKLEFFSVYNGLDYSSGWIAFYDYFETIGIIQHDEFEKYRDVFAKGIWNCILFENVCIISETPTSVLRDNRGRLHSTARHCVEFKDGYRCAYFIHGVKFEKGLWQKVVERKLTPKQLLEMKETDQRFVALNHYGFEKALKELNPKLVDKSKKGNKLYKIKFGEFDMKFLMYADTVNGNSRVSFVKPEFDDADQAMAWKHNMTKKQYLSLEIEA